MLFLLQDTVESLLFSLYSKIILYSLPKFLDGSLFLPCGSHMSGVVDGEEKDVPVAAEPGDEERTGKGLEGQLDHLSGAHPGGGDTEDHQQTP